MESEVTRSVTDEHPGVEAGEEEAETIFEDTNNHGPPSELFGGKVQVKKHGDSNAEVSAEELGQMESELTTIFEKGGENGKKLQKEMMADGAKTVIILNDLGINRAQSFGGGVLTIDLATEAYFLDYASYSVVSFSVTRLLSHELSHAILSIQDQIELNIIVPGGSFMRKTISPSVLLTDEIMNGINGTRRAYYENYICNDGDRC